MAETQTHWKSMTDRDYLGSWDLPRDRDVIVTIARCVAGQLTGEGGKKERKPILHFEGKDKALALNSTNAKAVAGIYGPYVEAWTGKRIALYVTQTAAFGQTVDCIRVRPTAPKPGEKATV